MFYLDKLIKHKAGVQIAKSLEKSSRNDSSYSYTNNISEEQKS